MKPDDTREYPVCRSCGSENVVCDAWASWDRVSQEWELEDTFDDTFCKDCETSSKLDWLKVQETPTERTRRLNDEMRERILTGGVEAYGTVVLTRGVADLGEVFVRQAAEAVARFDTFTEDNDPHAEHDFGAFEIDDEKLFWKLDYYSLDMQGHSPDKSDVGVTKRVLTIMLVGEY